MREYILFPSKLVSYFVSKCKIGGECCELMFVRDRERGKKEPICTLYQSLVQLFFTSEATSVSYWLTSYLNVFAPAVLLSS